MTAGKRVSSLAVGLVRAAFAVGACAGIPSGCGGQSLTHRETDASGGSAGVSAGNATGGTATGGHGGRAGSGLGGSEAGGSGAGGNAGTPGTPPLPPPPAPVGIFGELVDRFVLARANAVQSQCCAVFCCDDPDDLPLDCLDEEYRNFVPTAGHLACASRLAVTNAEVATYLSMQAACYETCAARNWPVECGGLGQATSCSECGAMPLPAALADCEASCSFNGRVCNGIEECANGNDELNCNPAARSFQCASGESVPWLSLCDGVAACADTSDEELCGANQCDGLLVTPSPVCDYGVPCSEARDCVSGDCYVPGTGQNPICSKQCTTPSECPLGSACIEVGGDGSHCFVRCTSDEACRPINDAPENPLVCVSFGDESVCIQRSEP